MSWYKLKRREFKILFFGSVIAVFIMAMIPSGDLNQHLNHADKLLHALTFFILSLLLNRASSTITHRIRNVIALLLFGIFIEIAQGFTNYRTPSYNDVIADLIGILLFQVFFSVYRFFKHFRNNTL